MNRFCQSGAVRGRRHGYGHDTCSVHEWVTKRQSKEPALTQAESASGIIMRGICEFQPAAVFTLMLVN